MCGGWKERRISKTESSSSLFAIKHHLSRKRQFGALAGFVRKDYLQIREEANKAAAAAAAAASQASCCCCCCSLVIWTFLRNFKFLAPETLWPWLVLSCSCEKSIWCLLQLASKLGKWTPYWSSRRKIDRLCQRIHNLETLEEQQILQQWEWRYCWCSR